MYDLFISYSSHDRPWAERLYRDLSVSFRTIRVFWDQASIPAGGRWRTLLTDGVTTTTHLAILWSQKAKDSIEVEPEIAAFEAEVRRAAPGTGKRLEFFFALQGNRGGGIQDVQGFPDFAAYYDPAAADRGVSKLDAEPAASRWKRAIQMIGDAILEAQAVQKVIAAVVATNTTRLPLLDQLRGLRLTVDGLTLDEFLAGFGLTWAAVSPRYAGPSAHDWRPFGGSSSIVDLLEDVRVQANNRLDQPYWFRWDHVDLTDPQMYKQNLGRLLDEPSVVVVDPISLYETYTANVFRGLSDYVRKEDSVILSLAPIGQTGQDWLTLALRQWSVPLMDDYFQPRIPPLSAFARCSINVQRIDEVERFVRARLGRVHKREREAEAKDLTGMGR